MPTNPMAPPPPSSLGVASNTGSTLQRANEDVPRRYARGQQEKAVASQPSAGKSAMQINDAGGAGGDSSNRNQYFGSEEKEDKFDKDEKSDDFSPRKAREFIAASMSQIPDIHTLFESLKTSGRKLIHFFVPFVESHPL